MIRSQALATPSAAQRARFHSWVPWGLAMLLLAGLAAGCGLRTNPQPLSNRIPPPQDVRIWMRDTQILIGWKNLSERLINRWEGLETYQITLSRLPLSCIECRVLERRELSLPADDKALVRGKDLTIYQFTPSGPPSTWVAQVSIEFSRGSSPNSPPVSVDAVGSIPLETLRWERVSPETLGTNGRPAVRLYWTARRERIVRIVTPGGGQTDRDLMYRVNLYLRVPPNPWPPQPVNPAPVDAQFWIGPEPVVLADPEARSVEYAMRLVDQYGNEGPASEPVSIPIAKGPGI